MSRQEASSRLLCAFDFYGAGNIGDDLMIDGLRRAASLLEPRPRIVCACAHDIASQRRRIVGVRWLDSAAFDALTPEAGDVWVGAGGTPFQMTSGDWFLRWLEGKGSQMDGAAHRVLLCVGAEDEIEGEADRFSRIARRFDRISTRDEHAAGVVRSLGVDTGRVFAGADLADISLAPLTKSSTRRPAFDLGLVALNEGNDAALAETLGAFVAESNGCATFIAGDVRGLAGFESDLARAARTSVASVDAPLLAPAYAGGSMEDLLVPFTMCERVVSWRYHGLLAAAWLGRRVGAVARSSKVRALAEDLGVPWRPSPVSVDDLRALSRDAVVVSRELLQSRRRLAIEALSWTLGIELDATHAAPLRRA